MPKLITGDYSGFQTVDVCGADGKKHCELSSAMSLNTIMGQRGLMGLMGRMGAMENMNFGEMFEKQGIKDRKGSYSA